MVSLGITKTFRRFFPYRSAAWGRYKGFLHSKKGLEVGGPSQMFSHNGPFPIYDKCGSMDGVNFSSATVWEGSLQEGSDFAYYSQVLGKQYISEATYLPMFKDNEYDFLASCHCLEHVANPLKALLEWKRVINDQGKIFLVLPHPKYTFDHRRKVTTIDHLLDDLNDDVSEGDPTHIEEFITDCDFEMCKAGYRNFEYFKEVCRNNATYRCIHQHVFSWELVRQMADYCQLQIEEEFDYKRGSMFFVLSKRH